MPSTSLIQLYFCPLDTIEGNNELTNKLRSWLSQKEMMKVDRYRQDEMKMNALYVRGLLRAMLSQYIAIHPNQWQFVYGIKGKPTLTVEQLKQTGLHFNLSHSGNFLLIGIIQSKNDNLKLGVDIEHTRLDTDIDAMLTRQFTQQEASRLYDLPQAQQRERFFDLWALKESYIKATGLGLAESLTSFWFDFSMAKKTKLSLQTVPSENNAYNIRSEEKMDVYRDIAPLFTTHTSLPLQAQWQSCFGRMNEKYRFAVTLGNSHPPMRLEAKWVDPNQLLTTCI